ncbi:VOC family protein [Derxia gummosa]|uniref:VOC family protein n=1 Tax=Derxia gummosa DSM 723 TaxID=1121388 RepID=A0A8B6XBM7_9BURK|nr:VOC family protein [Derxia gummosa]
MNSARPSPPAATPLTPTNAPLAAAAPLDAAGADAARQPGIRAPAARITGWDHVGIRVSDRDEALAFYARLGFRLVLDLPRHEAAELETADGVRINLIFNGARRPGRRNVLLDEPVKLPGMTHPAFVVPDLGALQTLLARHAIPITEGPHPIGPRRIALFVRDPDGNVLEFNQLIGGDDA